MTRVVAMRAEIYLQPKETSDKIAFSIFAIICLECRATIKLCVYKMADAGHQKRT